VIKTYLPTMDGWKAELALVIIIFIVGVLRLAEEKLSAERGPAAGDVSEPSGADLSEQIFHETLEGDHGS